MPSEIDTQSSSLESVETEDAPGSGDPNLVTALEILEAKASYSGPLPPASELRRYEEVLPGLAERIVGGWEEETRHRRAIEQRAVDEESRLLNRGQWLAAVLSTLFFAGSVYLVAMGHGIEGMAVVLAEIVALSTVFYLGRRSLGTAEERPAPEPTDD